MCVDMWVGTHMRFLAHPPQGRAGLRSRWTISAGGPGHCRGGSQHLWSLPPRCQQHPQVVTTNVSRHHPMYPGGQTIPPRTSGLETVTPSSIRHTPYPDLGLQIPFSKKKEPEIFGEMAEGLIL